MPATILLTKLYKPPLRPNHVHRPRLLQHLDDGLNLGQRFFLVSAPAGFGKSTLLTAWLASNRLPSAWFAIDETDDDSIQFWRYLIAAVRTCLPAFGDDLLQLLDAIQPPDNNAILNSFLNQLTASHSPFAIVLDDYHYIRNPDIQTMVVHMIDHIPQHLTLVVATRADPPFHLSRYRARSEMCEVRATDLRFDMNECNLFLTEKMRLDLSEDETQTLIDKTEGWAAGIHMAALSLQGRTDRKDFLHRFGGDDRYIADYLIDEVLINQPPDIKDFMLKTSFLERINADLANQLTGRQDGQAILNALERSNLFITPLDNRREWYRYHQLFANLLQQIAQQSWSQDDLSTLQHKTLQWYLDHALPIEAAQFALRIKDFHSAVMPLLMASQHLFETNQLGLVRHWGNQIPDDVIRSNPPLCLLFGWASHASGFFAETPRYLRLLEEHYEVTITELLMAEEGFDRLSPEARVSMVEAATIFARMALDVQSPVDVVDYCAKILPHLVPQRENDPIIFNVPYHLRPPVLFVQGLAYQASGETERAAEVLQEALRLARQFSNLHIIALASSYLGWIKIYQGELPAARRIFEESLKEAAYQHDNIPRSPFESNTHIGLGAIALEEGDVVSANAQLEKGLKFASNWRIWEVLLQGVWETIKLCLVKNDLPGARQALSIVLDMHTGEPQSVTATLGLLSAYLDALEGNEKDACDWLASQQKDEQAGYAYLYERGFVILARVCIHCGEPQKAGDLLSTRLSDARIHGRHGTEIEILVLLANLSEHLGDRASAEAYMLKALALAEPRRMMHVFHQYALPGHDILLRLTQVAQHAFARRIIGQTLPSNMHGNKAHLPSLPEPLTDRELEILAMLATGKSNTDIAQIMVISPHTVKKHTSNIYSKLEVNNRFEAVEKARSLGLLPL